MKDIIREMIMKADKEKDLELADIAERLMNKLAQTINVPLDWRNILDELYEEFSDNEWVCKAIWEFVLLKAAEEEEEQE